MKTLQLAAAALAVGVLAFPAKAASTTTNDWWNVDFESPTPGGVSLEVGSLGPLTNNGQSATAPYTNGLWSASAEDESFITNSFNSVTTNGYQFGYNPCLKLDTQGNDLTWTPDPNKVAKADGLKTLVDADLWLVGSDSEPTEFDDGGDVQAAIYLKNELYDDQALEHAGDVSNSVLCVYVYDSIGKKNYWQELDGVALSNEAWAHVQVIVDHTSADPVVQVYVNQVRMHKRNGDPSDVNYDQWSLANPGNSSSETRVNSVAFRGTGAVDNFVGVTLETTVDSFDFTAEVFMDNELVPQGQMGNVSRTAPAVPVGPNEKAEFLGFSFHDFVSDPRHESTFALARIELINQGDESVTTLNYGYDKHQVVPETVSSAVYFHTDTYYDDELEEEVEYQTGEFDVLPPTAGATSNAVIARIYFKSIGANNAFAETVIGGVYSTNPIVVAPGATFPLTTNWTFTANQGDNHLASIQVFNGASVSYDANEMVATVSVTINSQLAADTKYATATYAPGALAEGENLEYVQNGDTWTFSKYTPPPPPVAIIVAGATTNEYPSLRAAVADATAGDTIRLVADDHVSFSVENPALVIDKALTIDGGSNTVYGVSDYDFSNLEIRHAIRVTGNGDVTIFDLTLSEFGGSAPTVQYYTYPIWALPAYTGTITLDNVTVTKFARSAFNFRGGSFVVENCTVDGYADYDGLPEIYFQDGFTADNASGSVSNTVMTGLGSANTDEASCFTLKGNASLTVYDGTYTAPEYVVGLIDGQTATLDIRGGTFVSTKPGSIFNGETNGLTATISGGWFTLAPEKDFIAPGYVAVQDADHAPDANATWTVKAAAVQIEGVDGGAWPSIADAQAAAPTYGVDDPVFVIVAPLSAETVTLATVDDTLTVKTDDTGYLANLTVETSVASTEAVEYKVEPRTTGMGQPITVFYEVVPTYYVAKIVDGATTTKYETFEEAATAAAAENATLVVEMLSTTNANETATSFGLDAGYVLMVKKNGFDVPDIDSSNRSYYVEESEPDGAGVTTYVSMPWLTATFLNGDGSQIAELLVKAGQTPPLTKDQDDEVMPYPPEQPGYVINHHLFSWSPALGPIYTNTTFHPLFTTNVTQYSIQYTLDGGAWPAGYTPPEWYAVTNATIELPSPVKDGWTFNGWYTNKTDGAYVGDLMNPGVIPTGSYGPKFFYAAWEENSVEPPKVDVGQGLAAYNAAHPDAPVEPIAFAIPEGGQTELCHLSFVAPEDGWYFLYTSTTVAGQYLPDYTTKKHVSKDELVTLVESEAGTTKFFKIGWSETEPSAN